MYSYEGSRGRIGAIKSLRNRLPALGLGLKEAKDIVDKWCHDNGIFLGY